MSTDMHVLISILIMALVTAAIRFLPFLVFSKKTPKALIYLGEVLPYSVMAMLVVYCLKGVSFIKGSYGLPEAVSLLVVFILHKLKHNTLLSIVGGTVCYMLLVQLVVPNIF